MRWSLQVCTICTSHFALSVMHSRVHPTSQVSDQHYDLLLTRCCDVLKCPLMDNDQWHPATLHFATEAKLRFSSGVCLANSTHIYYQCGIMCIENTWNLTIHLVSLELWANGNSDDLIKEGRNIQHQISGQARTTISIQQVRTAVSFQQSPEK